MEALLKYALLKHVCHNPLLQMMCDKGFDETNFKLSRQLQAVSSALPNDPTK
jgi:hypothetical protein